MKPLSPHDPRNEQPDDLIAAALHGELTPEERAQFDSRLSNDPAARAAYLEAQAMHDLLEKTHQSAQPDAAFEQRMVSGIRRKLQDERHRETAWESLLVLRNGLRRFITRKRTPMPWFGSALAIFMILFILWGISLGPITRGIKQAQQSAAMQEAHQKALADYQAQVDAGNPNPVMKDVREFMKPEAQADQSQANGVFSTITSQLADADNTKSPPASPPSAVRLAHLDRLAERYQEQLRMNPSNQDAAKKLANIEAQRNRYDGFAGGVTLATAGELRLEGGASTDQPNDSGLKTASNQNGYNEPTVTTVPQGGTIRGEGFAAPTAATTSSVAMPSVTTRSGMQEVTESVREFPYPQSSATSSFAAVEQQKQEKNQITSSPDAMPVDKSSVVDANVPAPATNSIGAPAAPATPAPSAEPQAIDNRKLIRNAQLDLEVKSFQDTMDKITTLTKAAGGYVDTSNSQKGGNGKLQGTVVVKVLPQNLDAFLLKLRDLGQMNNQSVSTDDVTKDYFDTQARLENSRRMETQLQDLLKRENGKVSDLLAVERELGRVRGDIEQMQGQLKLYDFQVQYATVTMNISEKDLNQTAAYLLKEQDDFSLFATDVEGTFQKARQTADTYKAQILTANLNHNSGSDVSAELEVMVAPDQIESFLNDVRSLGRVANFTRQTQRVAKDGGDSDHPADETLTEKDKVQVHLAIRSDDETRKQVALTVVAKAVDTALDQAKAAALANPGVEILSSALNKTPQGESTAQLSVRVPGKDYSALIEAFGALGRTATLSIQRNDNSGPGANGDDAPVIVSLSLTDNDTPLQETEISILANDVDAQAQQIKKDAASTGVEVKASSFERQPDGTELAQMTFRLPMAKYAAFVDALQKLGKVESLSVHRDDRPDETRTDDTAPAEISLQLHNQRGIVADNGGLWETLRQTFGDGAGALFSSIRVIGVIIAFLVPWAVTLILIAWIGRRIYIWRKK